MSHAAWCYVAVAMSHAVNVAMLQFCMLQCCNSACCNVAILHVAMLQFCMLQCCNSACCNVAMSHVAFCTVQLIEPWRRDFPQMMAHHFITFFLIISS
jgi:hypothetical protein